MKRVSGIAIGIALGFFSNNGSVIGQDFYQIRNPAPLPMNITPSVTAHSRAPSVLEVADHTRLQQVRYAKAIAKRSHILTAKEGTINGRILWLESQPQAHSPTHAHLNLYFVRSGQIVHQTKTDKDGNFTLSGVTPGMYSFIASGAAGFAAYGVLIRDQDEGGNNTMEAAAVSLGTPGLAEVLDRFLPPQVSQAIVRNGSRSGTAVQPAGARVRLIDGELAGTIYRFDEMGQPQSARGTIVNLVRDGKPIADVTVSADGSYSLQNLAPGIYNCVAVGQQGFAAFRFEAIPQDSPMTTVSFHQTKLVATSLDIVLTAPQPHPRTHDSVVESPTGRSSSPGADAAETSEFSNLIVSSPGSNQFRQPLEHSSEFANPRFIPESEISRPAPHGGFIRSRLMGGGRFR